MRPARKSIDEAKGILDCAFVTVLRRQRIISTTMVKGRRILVQTICAHRAGRKHSRPTRHPASSCVRLTRALWLTARSVISNVSP